MRVGGFGVILAGLALSVVGCGTQVAGSVQLGDVLTAAVSQTTTQTARVAVTTSVTQQSMTTSFTATGVFDFAHSRGILSMGGPMSMAEVFLPPKMYIKLPVPGGAVLPKGKTWLAVSGADPGASGASGASGPFGMFGGTGSPADLLASLTAISGGEEKVGTTTIRGVPVTEYQVNIDPAKAAARLPAAERASFRQFASMLGSGTIPVHVWVDSKSLVRRIQVTLKPSAAALGISPSPGSSGSGLSGGSFQASESTDYYDFGVAVHVSAPPAAQVASMPDLSQLATPGSGMYPQPPKATGTLTAGQETAAGQAVAAFWTALGQNDPAAVTRVVLPSQQSCVQSGASGGPKITVSSFRIVSVEPAGTGKATVRYKVTAKVQGLPGLIPKDTVQWMSATEDAGHWYVNLSTGSFLGGTCP